MVTSSPPLLLESMARWCCTKLKQYRVPAISGMVFGVLAYMFAFTNKLVNHDEVYTLFSKGATFTSGRWGLEALELIFPGYSMPWIYGVLTIGLITLSVCLMVSLFSIRSTGLQVLLAGCVMVFPSLIGTFTYMFTSSSYALSFLLAVLSVWLVTRPSKWAAIPALVCLVGSLSIYQSYIAIAASLLVLVLIQRLLKDESIPAIIRSGVFFVLFLAVSLGIYYAATLVINRICGVSFSAYAGGGMSFRISELPQKIVTAYRNFFQFFSGYRGLMPGTFSQLMHTLTLALTAALLLLWSFSRKRQPAQLVWLLILLVLLPLAVNCMYLFTTEDAVHTLVLYGFIAIYVLSIIAADSCLCSVPEGTMAGTFRQITANLLSIVLAVIITCNTYLANETFLLLHLRYENAYSFYTSLVADIKMTPGFDESTRLAVVGFYREPAYYLEKFPFSDHITGADGFLPDVYSKDRFLEYYLGFPIPMVSDEEIEEIKATAEYIQMPVYPYYGCMQLIGDTFVVKLS